MRKRNSDAKGQGAKLLIVGVALTAILASPLAGSAANLSSGKFHIKAENAAEKNYFAIRPAFGNEGVKPSPEPTAPPTSPTPEAPADPMARTVAMTIDTSLPGCVPSNFSLEFYARDYLPDAQINWGDGATTAANEGKAYTHSYAPGSKYELTVDGKMQGIHRSGTREVPGYMNGAPGANECILSLDHIGSETGMTAMPNMLRDAKNIQHVAAPPKSVTDLSGFFDGASNYNEDISGWDTSNVTNMNSMFMNADSFNRDLSKWNVSRVTDFIGMFSYTDSFNGDLNGWDVSSARLFDSMFQDAKSFNRDLDRWDVSSARSMSSMFSGTESFNGDVSTWKPISVTNMANMFFNSKSFNQDLNGWTLNNVMEFNGMFSGATAFNGDISGWIYPGTTRMGSFLSGATSFNRDISNWDLSWIYNERFANGSGLTQEHAPRGITIDKK